MEPEQVRNIMDSMIRKLYSMELEGQERSNRQDEKLLSEVRKLGSHKYDFLKACQVDRKSFFEAFLN